jgi:phosphatidylinositol alpha-1,6-mannosyltransferase
MTDAGHDPHGAHGRPRLLLLTPDFPPEAGGIQVMAHRLAAGIERFQTRTLALDSVGAEAFDAAGGLAVRRIGARGAPRAQRNVLLNLRAVREASRFRPQVTLSMHMVASPAAVLVRRGLGAPFVQYFHAKEIPARPRLTAFAADRADAVIAVSAYCAELIAAAGAHPADLRLIPPGVDLPAQADGQREPRPTIVTVARMEDRYKGHDVMAQALGLVKARIADVQWVVLGDGSLRAEIEAQVRAAGVAEAVHFLGAVSDSERDRWLARGHVLAMPSRLPGPGRAGEGFGIAFMEAAAHGTPVVAGNVGGALDSVADGESGLLVDPHDPSAVAAAIVELLSDGELARRMGAAAAARARAYAWPLIVARVEEVLLEQLGPSARTGAGPGAGLGSVTRGLRRAA